MGIAVPSQLRKASDQLIMALIGYSGLGVAGYGWAGLGGWTAPLAFHRDGPFLCGNGEHLINGLCKKKRSAEAEPEAYYGYGGYGGYGLGYTTGYGLGYGYGGYGRGLLPLRPMPTTAMEDMVDSVLAAMVPTTLAMDMAVMARGQLTLRLMPTMAM